MTAPKPLPDGRYRVRVFADSEPVLRVKRDGRWYLPGSERPIRVATWVFNGPVVSEVSDRLYAEILPAEGGPV